MACSKTKTNAQENEISPQKGSPMHSQNCLLLIVILFVPATVASIARPGCNDTCGNVQIPFPFGIGPKCSLHSWYTIECRASSNPNGSNKPFLSVFNVQVLEIAYDVGYNNEMSTQNMTVAIPPLSAYTSEMQLQHPHFYAVMFVLGFIVLVIGFYGLYRLNKKRREKKRRCKFFKRNGGLLLQQELSSNDGNVEKTRIFTMTELNKATDKFNENRILGQGGQGTVYKGMLADGRIVAVKKSKLLDENRLHQFINEVVILSQINHRNVVKLLGCCLEAQIPLLVYEFIPNGTLFHHIHEPDEDFSISWEMRLKIAADAATAIAHLHSYSSMPIYHRDIKSSNILLDEKNRAKVSDFGISKTTPVHISYFVTDVRGTFGYVDPEYYRTLRFTGKSDVYSFGIVLLELLTGKKAVYGEEPDVRNLAAEFLHLMDGNRLSEILDPEIVNEATEDELLAVIELTRRCLSWNGKLRPSMKEVAMALEMIMKSPAQVSTWYQEAFPTPDEGLHEEDEMAETEISEVEFMSNPLPSGALSPLCIDVKLLLPHTL